MTDTIVDRPGPAEPTRDPGRARRVDWRLVTSLVLLTGIAADFWLTSRYPSLNEKALVAQGFDIQGQVGFGQLLTLDPNAWFGEEIAVTAVNWLWANRQGMVFGVLFGAVLLTVLSLVKRRSFTSTTANSALGVVVGAPLGVCVNCAAPISHGMRVGGARPETALAAMFASPTYNVIVVSIALSLLPGWMVIGKLGLTLLFILFVVPRLARHVPLEPPELRGPRWVQRLLGRPLLEDQALGPDLDGQPPIPPGPLASVGWVLRSVLRNLWEVGRLAVPMMVLGGLVSAAIVVLLPFADFVGGLPQGSVGPVLAALVAVSVVGLLLPSPIAFDVVVAGALWAAGLPVEYVAALYFTLGIYSVYSGAIVAAVFTRRVALTLAAVLAVMGLVSGVAAIGYQEWEHRREAEAVERALETMTPPPIPAAPATTPADEVLAMLETHRVEFAPAEGVSTDDPALGVEFAPFAEASEATGRFVAVSGEQLGFDDNPRKHPAYNRVEGLAHSGGVAVGDVHGDGWDDVVITADFGPTLYANTRGRFVAQELAGGALVRDSIGIVGALVDLDVDGDLDVVASYMDGTTWLARNDGSGRFPESGVTELPSLEAEQSWVTALAAGDLDHDGDVDLVAGTWSAERGHAPTFVWRSTDGEFVSEELPGTPGPTLTTLLSDLNGDGWLDLGVGNDFEEPDSFYVNDGSGALQRVSRDDGLIPVSARTTMSMNTADVDGDLDLDLLIAQISGTPDASDGQPTQAYGHECRAGDLPWTDRCRDRVLVAQTERQAAQRRSFGPCLQLASDRVEACVTSAAVTSPLGPLAETACPAVGDGYGELQRLCGQPVGEVRRGAPELDLIASTASDDIPSQRNHNILHVSDRGRFTDEAPAHGIERAGWVWDASFFDADADGDLDLTMTNGTTLGSNPTTRDRFFRNDAGRFDDVTEEVRFGTFWPSTGSAPIDHDRDGDLDVIVFRIDAPPVLFENRLGGAVPVVLEFRTAARVAPGTSVTARNESGGHHLRELAVGSGYRSFDAPIVTLPTGRSDRLVFIEFAWGDGLRGSIDGVLQPGRYRLVERS